MEINLSALRRSDDKISKTLLKALQAAVYRFDSGNSSWTKTNAEGTMFICSRVEEPRYILFVMNKLNRDNFTEAITSDMDVVQENDQYLLYRKSNDYIRAVWFSNKDDCSSIARIINEIVAGLRCESKLNSSNPGPKPNIVNMLDVAQKHTQKTIPHLVKPVAIPVQHISLLHGGGATHPAPMPVGGEILRCLMSKNANKVVATTTNSSVSSSGTIVAATGPAAVLGRSTPFASPDPNSSGGGGLVKKQQMPELKQSSASAGFGRLDDQPAAKSNANSQQTRLVIKFDGDATGLQQAAQKNDRMGSVAATINATKKLAPSMNNSNPPKYSSSQMGYSTSTTQPSLLTYDRSFLTSESNGGPVLLTPADLSFPMDDLTIRDSYSNLKDGSNDHHHQQSQSIDLPTVRTVLFDLIQNDDEFVKFVFEKMMDRLENTKKPN